MGYKIMLDNKIGTSTYKTKEQAEQVAEYIQRVFKDLDVKIIKEEIKNENHIYRNI